MNEHEELEALFAKHGYTDFKWIDPAKIIVAQWVRLKCIFGCSHYGQNAACPPNVPSIAECRQLFGEYRTAAIFHFEKWVAKPEDRHEWTRKVNQGLLELEREVFLAGNQKAFLLPMDSCGLCKECAGTRAECTNPKQARPTPEAMGVDVYATVRQLDFPIQVLSDYTQAMNRYAFLLVE